MPISGFDAIYAACAARPARTVAVAGADDPLVLEGLQQAVAVGLLRGGVLAARDTSVVESHSGLLPLSDGGGSGFQLVKCASDAECCVTAAAVVRSGACDFLMKGQVHTDEFMRAVLSKEHGLTAGGLLSQIGVYEIPALERVVLIADVGIVIAPTLAQKVQILQNAVCVAHSLGESQPKAAILSCVETVNPAVPGSLDAAVITQMTRRGQIRGVRVDGPLALDNALFIASARQKGIDSEIAGESDILIVPDLNAGNMLAKSVIYLTGSRSAGVVVGAMRPIVLTSRADSPETRMNSIAVAAML